MKIKKSIDNTDKSNNSFKYADTHLTENQTDLINSDYTIINEYDTLNIIESLKIYESNIIKLLNSNEFDKFMNK